MTNSKNVLKFEDVSNMKLVINVFVRESSTASILYMFICHNYMMKKVTLEEIQSRR